MTPRFSLSTSDEMLDVCRQLLGAADGDIWFTSHVNENLAEVQTVADLFPGRPTTSTPTTGTAW